MVWHPNVIVPANARVGKNCTFHGNNVIGNDGGNGAAATIGDNADFGIGASVIGRIELADSVRIGAGAVVVRSCRNNKTKPLSAKAHKHVYQRFLCSHVVIRGSRCRILG